MGFVLQTQRRAIEAVFERRAIGLSGNFFLENQLLKFIGVSRGVGTCSDEQFHGINIAVFCEADADDRLRMDAAPHAAVDGAVLLRNKKTGDTDNDFIDTSLCMVVEGLVIKFRNDEKIVFASNRRIKMYIPI